MALAIERTAGAERELAEAVLQLGERHSAEHDVFDLTPACWTCQTHYRFGRVLGVDRGVSAGHLKNDVAGPAEQVVERTVEDIEHVKEKLRYD